MSLKNPSVIELSGDLKPRATTETMSSSPKTLNLQWGSLGPWLVVFSSGTVTPVYHAPCFANSDRAVTPTKTGSSVPPAERPLVTYVPGLNPSACPKGLSAGGTD